MWNGLNDLMHRLCSVANTVGDSPYVGHAVVAHIKAVTLDVFIVGNWRGIVNMNAKEARKATEQSERDEWAAKRVLQETESRKQKAEDARALREDWDKFWKEIKKEIKIATKERCTACRVKYSNAALAAKAVDLLRSDGYGVNKGHDEGYENYGDFNAPCNIWVSTSWLDISW